MKRPIELVIFDMLGTVIQDNYAVENSFNLAAELTGLEVDTEKTFAFSGRSKYEIFDSLWREKLLGLDEKSVTNHVRYSYNTYCEILENYYLENDVLPVKGAADLFRHLRQNKVRIAFNTDLHRNVTDLILDKINWYGSRKQIHVPIDEIVCSDEVSSGRPLPYMIFKTMEKLMIDDTKKVIKIGDTPSDLAEGRNAGCLYSLGIPGGFYSVQKLKLYENDGIMKNLYHFMDFLDYKFFS